MAKGTIRVHGLREVRNVLNNMAPREGRNLLRSSVHGTATDTRDKIRKGAPKDGGALRKSITARRRRGSRETVASEVRIDDGKRDAFYWRFIEFGYGGGKGSHKPYMDFDKPSPQPNARPFILPVVEALRKEAPGIFQAQFGKKLAAFMRRKIKKARK